ncbi:PspC domain-containing protein [Corynebacterium tapiri]|uniref:PspC domain-containing protein n=2 Tax=Corynebacterium tapiri TaxID=1448266 RepID=A0A5C4U4T9_9CORY|nr:PspC domain-containing protein [Corynebacterium tapiri]
MLSAYASDPTRAYPTYTRARKPRTVAGVAAGLAQHLRVDVSIIRAVFIGSSLLGVGIIFYLLLWVFVRRVEVLDDVPDRFGLPRLANLLLLVGALFGLSFVGTVSVSLPGGVVLPLVAVGVGALFAWQAYDRGLSSATGTLSLLVGAGLVIGGLSVALVWWDNGGMSGAVISVLLTLAGVVVLAGPAVLKLWESAAQSRAEKVAADERAEIAARLHDSVLQTLALIQKRSHDSDEVARLARAQERELRGWLFDAEDKTGEQTVLSAVQVACGEVEDMFGIRIAPITVGTDRPLDESSQAIVLSAREAMVNAAKHAGVDSVDVYAELLGNTLEIYVRDRGAGFDVGAIPEDRHGIRDSIRARVNKAGGDARIKSSVGSGTEVRLTLSYDA